VYGNGRRELRELGVPGRLVDRYPPRSRGARQARDHIPGRDRKAWQEEGAGVGGKGHRRVQLERRVVQRTHRVSLQRGSPGRKKNA